VCNSLFAILWSVFKKVSHWNNNDLDHIIREGTKLYVNLGYTCQYLSVDDLPRQVTVESEIIQIQMLENLSHIISDGGNESVLHNSYQSSSDKG
ncbi:hypothetical protein, partial [Acinetobacter baumannii]|uniref:hypothetical protein n=1 Tax=Acinetobacter baumannii TaxID=470 RepID=UPI001C076FDF